jgi:phospholipid/cholesterol/gamma-HCH transport system substrate-binding protein
VKVRLNHFERMAGLFVLAAVLGTTGVTAGLALKQGWFSPRVAYSTTLTSAEGLSTGTAVQIAGLRAGRVTDVRLVSRDEVRVDFYVFSRFQEQVREDSRVLVMRPFVIGEKVLDVGVGSPELPVLEEGRMLEAEVALDLMDLLGGRRLGTLLAGLEAMMDQATRMMALAESLAEAVAESVADSDRVDEVFGIVDGVVTLIDDLSAAANEVTRAAQTLNRDGRLERTFDDLLALTAEMNKILPQINEAFPDLGVQLAEIVANLVALIGEFQALTPVLAELAPVLTEMAPEVPGASQRAMEALDETVVTLRALQRTLLLRGSVREVLEEEEAARAEADAPVTVPAPSAPEP